MRGRHRHGFGGRLGRHDFGGEREEGFRTRRGDIKYLILSVLGKGPRHGYEVIRELEEQSGGTYRPSPGSVYPTLQMLEEQGYISSEQLNDKRVYTIKEEGRKLLDKRGEVTRPSIDEATPAMEVKRSVMKLIAAAEQAVDSGDEEMVKRVTGIINQARREIYTLLAEM